MQDDGMHGDGIAGDGVYGAKLPAFDQGEIIEYFIYAADGEGNARTWPAGERRGQTTNALFQVDAADLPEEQAVYRLIMTPREQENFNRNSTQLDTQMNVTFIASTPSGTEVRYLAGVRLGETVAAARVRRRCGSIYHLPRSGAVATS